MDYSHQQKPSSLSPLSKTELQAIQKVIQNLNHYQLLKISSVAPEAEIRASFHREALAFHPDQYLALNDPERLKLTNEIYSRIVSAYQTLIHSQKKMEYDKSLQSKTSSDPATSDKNNATTSVGEKPLQPMATAGFKFFKLAQAALTSKNISAALMNIEIALKTDSKNAEYIHMKHRIQTELKKVPPKTSKVEG